MSDKEPNPYALLVAKFLSDAGLTNQAELARHAGCAPNTLRRFLKGKTKTPTYATLAKYAHAASVLLGRKIYICELLTEITSDEIRLVEAFRQLSPDQQEAMVSVFSKRGAMPNNVAANAPAGLYRLVAGSDPETKKEIFGEVMAAILTKAPPAANTTND